MAQETELWSLAGLKEVGGHWWFWLHKSRKSACRIIQHISARAINLADLMTCGKQQDLHSSKQEVVLERKPAAIQIHR